MNSLKFTARVPSCRLRHPSFLTEDTVAADADVLGFGFDRLAVASVGLCLDRIRPPEFLADHLPVYSRTLFVLAHGLLGILAWGQLQTIREVQRHLLTSAG